MFYSELETARMVLEYSLLLEINQSIKAPNANCEIKDVNEWIDNIFSITHENCSKNISPSNFFQINNHNVDSTTDLSFYESGIPFWKFILKQEAILFSYKKIREIIATMYVRTTHNSVYLLAPYDSNENKIDTDNIYGLYYHYKSKHNLEEVFNKPPISSKDNAYIIDKYKSYTGSTINTLKLLYEKLREHYDLDCLYNSDIYIQDNYKYLLQANTLEFTQCVGLTYGNKNFISAKPIINAYQEEKPSKKAFDKYYNAFLDLNTELYIPGLDKEPADSKANNKLELADKVYCRYLIERVFSLSTIDCLYQNLSNPIEYNGRHLQPNDLKECFLLPNALSRQYIIQMVTNAFKHEYDKEREISTTSVMHGIFHYTPEAMAIEHDTIWRTRYKKMINLLYKFFIPIYNNYFFITLWESISGDKLTEAFALVSKYLNDTDNVKNLFSLDSTFFPYDFDSSKIIKPFDYNYSESKTINYKLYFDCIKASTAIKYNENVVTTCYDDFLNLDYIKSIDSNIDKSIQMKYTEFIKNSL